MNKNVKFSLLGLIFAILPILDYYSIGFSFSLGMLLLLFLYVVVLLVKRKLYVTRTSMYIYFLTLLILYAWISKSIGANAGTMIMSCLSLIVFGEIDIRNDKFIYFMRKCVWVISCIATSCIIIQYVGHYVLDINFRFIILKLLDADIYVRYIQQIQTNLIAGQFFRPAAFFLEPSHMAAYCLPGIICAFFEPSLERKKKLVVAVYITLGIALTTSGLGTIISMIIWFVFYTKYYKAKRNEKNNKINIKRLFKIIIIMLIAFIFLLQIDAFATIVREYIKAFSIEYTGVNYNPLLGRTGTYDNLFKRGLYEFLFGAGFMNTTGYLTTLNALLYDIGLFSVIFTIVFIIRIFKKSEAFSKMICILVMLLLIVTEIHSPIKIAFFMLLARHEYNLNNMK